MVHTRDLRHEPWRYRLRAFVSKPANLLLVFFLIVLVLLSLMPMATMLSNMFTVHVGTEKKLLRLPGGILHHLGEGFPIALAKLRTFKIPAHCPFRDPGFLRCLLLVFACYQGRQGPFFAGCQCTPPYPLLSGFDRCRAATALMAGAG